MRQGAHPSMHPGVLRYIESFIGIQAPVPATAAKVFARFSLNRGVPDDLAGVEQKRRATC